MKIVQIMPEFGLAGAEVMVESLTYGLIDQGIEVIVISLYDYKSAITERLENKGVKIFYLGKKSGLDLSQIYKIYKILKKEKPDVIHTHRYVMQYAIPAAVLAKVKGRVHTVHNIAKKEVGRFQRCLANKFYKYANVIPVAISPKIEESIIEEYKLNEEKIPMIYNGIMLENCIVKKTYENSKDETIILHIGRFSKQKNHIELIESFKLVHDINPKTKLKLIGAGELENSIREKIVSLELEKCVDMVGIKSNVYEDLNNADIFVLPSLWEGMPITLIEAMGTGIPIIASNVGGIPDMLQDGSDGILVDLYKENIANALIALINNVELRTKLGENARRNSVKFSSEKMAKTYMEVYKSGIKGE